MLCMIKKNIEMTTLDRNSFPPSRSEANPPGWVERYPKDTQQQ